MLPVHLLLRCWPSLSIPGDEGNLRHDPAVARAENKTKQAAKVGRTKVAKQLLEMLNKANPCALEKQDGVSEEAILANIAGTSVLSLDTRSEFSETDTHDQGGKDGADIAKMQEKFAIHSPSEHMINQYAGSPLHLLCAGPAMRSDSANLLFTLVKLLHSHHDRGGDLGLHFTSFGRHGKASKADKFDNGVDQRTQLLQQQRKTLEETEAADDTFVDYSCFQDEVAVGHLFTNPPVASPLHILCANPFISPSPLRLLLRAWPAGAKLVRNDAHPLHLLCANPSVGGEHGAEMVELMLEACKHQAAQWDVKQAHLVRAGSPLMILCANPRLTIGVLEKVCTLCPWMVLLREQGRDHIGGAGTKGGVSGQTCLHQLCSNPYAVRHDLLQALLRHMRRLLLLEVAQVQTRQEDAAHAFPGRSVHSHPESGQFVTPEPHSDGSKPSQWHLMGSSAISSCDSDPLRRHRAGVRGVFRDENGDGLEGNTGHHHIHLKKVHEHHKQAAKGLGVGGDTLGIASIEKDSRRTALHLLCSNPRVDDNMVVELLQMEKDITREEARAAHGLAVKRAMAARQASGAMILVAEEDSGSNSDDGVVDAEEEAAVVAAAAAAAKEEDTTTSCCMRDAFGQLPLHRLCCNKALLRRAAQPGKVPDVHLIVRLLIQESSSTPQRMSVSWEDDKGLTPLQCLQATLKEVGAELAAEQEKRRLKDGKQENGGRTQSSVAQLAQLAFVNSATANIEVGSSDDDDYDDSNVVENGVPKGDAKTRDAALAVSTSATVAATATAMLSSAELSRLYPVTDHCYHHYPTDELRAQSELDILILGEEREQQDVRGSGFHEDSKLAVLHAKARSIVQALKQALQVRRISRSRLKQTNDK
jgi:hypothetical protein